MKGVIVVLSQNVETVVESLKFLGKAFKFASRGCRVVRHGACIE